MKLKTPFNFFIVFTTIAAIFCSCSKDSNEESEPTVDYSSYIETVTAEDITTNSATLIGELDVAKLMGQDYTIGMVYSSTVSSSKDLVAGQSGVEVGTTDVVTDKRFAVEALHLAEQTLYSYRAFIKIGQQYYYTNIRTFTTQKGETDFSSYIKTVTAENITANSATLVGELEVSKLMGQEYTLGMVYSSKVSSSNDLIVGKSGVEMSTTDALTGKRFAVDVANLTDQTSYSYRAFIKIGQQYYYADVLTFTTLKGEYVNPNAGKPVDMGLPSGISWADINIKNGDDNAYYAFGVVTPTPNSGGSKNDTYYGYTTSALKAQGIIDANGNLTPEHDPAREAWGGKWRTPTREEFLELLDSNNCTWVRVDAGWDCVSYKVISNKNGNSIMFETTGFYEDNKTWIIDDHPAAFWTSTISDKQNRAFCMSWANTTYMGNYYYTPVVNNQQSAPWRNWSLGLISYALCVRPVMDR